MSNLRWADYSGSPPILVPVNLLNFWRGDWISELPDEPYPEFSEEHFSFHGVYDFENPVSDYDRLCSPGATPVRSIAIGPGYGLVLTTHTDSLTWLPESLTLFGSSSPPTSDMLLPTAAEIARAPRYDDLDWIADDANYLLMNSWDHGGNPEKDKYFDVRLVPGRYVVRSIELGNDTVIRFIPQGNAT